MIGSNECVVDINGGDPTPAFYGVYGMYWSRDAGMMTVKSRTRQVRESPGKNSGALDMPWPTNLLRRAQQQRGEDENRTDLSAGRASSAPHTHSPL